MNFEKYSDWVFIYKVFFRNLSITDSETWIQGSLNPHFFYYTLVYTSSIHVSLIKTLLFLKHALVLPSELHDYIVKLCLNWHVAVVKSTLNCKSIKYNVEL